MSAVKILLIGSGAREHALARAFNRSPQHPQLFCYANSINPGIQSLVKEYGVGDLNQVVAWAKERSITFAFIGPEAPLEQGLADALWQADIPVIGPKKILAQIETSKAFARDLMRNYHIPGSIKYRVFDSMQGEKEFLQELGEGHYVIKANGLMGGKGVKVAGDHLHSFDEALTFCQQIVNSKQSFVIEEKLIGQEFSLLSFCDGNTVISMPCVQDHKRAFVGDQGPNTGGMGSYSDVDHRLPFLSAEEVKTAHHINEAVIQALQQECGEHYIGILYGSFIATRHGISVIEFNARFGDPEAMNVLAILETDLVAICQSMISGNLADCAVRFAKKATVCKYAVPEGYPDHGIKNAELDVSAVEHSDQLYMASVKMLDGKLVTCGSRAVAVVGIGDSIAEAEAHAEAEIQRIRGKVFHRPDIGTAQLIDARVVEMQKLRLK